MPQRPLTTRAGEVVLAREQWRCTTCRVVFPPLDQKLQLGTEGHGLRVLQKAVRQGGKAPSFQDASADLQELAEVAVSPTHLRRLTERVGREWAGFRDTDVQAFRQGQLPCTYAEAPRRRR